jgi:hypothetical protein
MIRALAFSDTNLFAGTAGMGVFLSPSFGQSWATSNAGIESCEVLTFVVSPLSGGAGGRNLYAGTSGNGVILSGNNGTAWVTANNGLTHFDVRALAVSSNDAGTGVTRLFAGTLGGGMFVSTNGGANWTTSNIGLTDPDVLSIAVAGRNVFVGTFEGGVFLSTNGGANWAHITTPFKMGRVDALAVSDLYLFAGAGTLVWRYPLSELVGVKSALSEHLTNFTLGQNYPNPFNPSTTIRYGLPQRSHVILAVYNTLGQSVSTLVNGETEAGVHEARFDAAGLSSGVYFYRMQAGDYVSVRRMLVLK